MNDLLFSIAYENVRLRDADNGSHEPWYSVLPITAREHLNSTLARMAGGVGLSFPASRLAFLFTQVMAAATVFALACLLAMRRWPADPREELLRRAFLCLAWLWFLSATQNPWYWTWALPLVVFVSRPWLLVSGFALIYYLRFWLVHQFPSATPPGGFTGMRFFDEVVVWIEHLPPLLALFLVAHFSRKCRRAASTQNVAAFAAAKLGNVIVIIPALNEEACLPDVLARLHSIGLNRIRVVDNGSNDRTAEVARQSRAEVIVEPRRGYGQACWAGCANLPPDAVWILFCNADGSDDIERVPTLLSATEGGDDFILGTRTPGDDGDDHLTPTQRFGNKLATALIHLLWGASYGDLGPLRLISRHAFDQLAMQDRGFGWTVEMQVRAAEERLRVHEVSVRNFPRRAGVSTISGTVKGSVKAGTVILATIVSLWLRRLSGAIPLTQTP